MALHHKPVAEMLQLYRRKFSIDDIAHVLIGLSYFDDAEQEPMPRMVSGVSWDEVKRDVSRWVKQIAG